MASRRVFLRALTFAAIPVALSSRRRQDPPTGQARPLGSGSVPDTLAVPLDRNSAPIGPLDNDPIVIGIERRIRCSCGCTLDVYTCRTTDFSCTFSPAMHAKVVAQTQLGRTPEKIVQWCVAQPEYGEKILMAPEARGFNLMGYIVPGLTVAAFGLALAAWLVRKRPAAAPASQSGAVTPPPMPDSEQLARLQRALDDVES